MRFPMLIVTLFALGCQAPPGEGSKSDQDDNLDFEHIATTIGERMNLNPGERVFILMSPGRCDSLIPLLREEIENAGFSSFKTALYFFE